MPMRCSGVSHGYTPVVVDSLEQHSLGLGKPRRGVLLIVGIDFYKGLALNFRSRRAAFITSPMLHR